MHFIVLKSRKMQGRNVQGMNVQQTEKQEIKYLEIRIIRIQRRNMTHCITTSHPPWSLCEYCSQQRVPALKSR